MAAGPELPASRRPHVAPRGLGAGFLHVAPDAAAALRPRHVGYRRATAADEGIRFEDGAARLEVGTQSVAPYAELREAIAVREEVGPETVTERVRDLATRLPDGLGARALSPRPPESGLITFAAAPDATVSRLAEEDIHVRSLPGGEAVRASVHVFNTPGDVDALLAAL